MVKTDNGNSSEIHTQILGLAIRFTDWTYVIIVIQALEITHDCKVHL